MKRVLTQGLRGLLAFSIASCPSAWALELISPGFYVVTAETAMPHLEENLRYATTREQRCLTDPSVLPEFPILRHDSLKGCKLENETRVEESVTYSLACAGGQGIIGTAQWLLGADEVRGRLDIRLGGKNMTFYQQVTAKRLGDCRSGAR